MSMMCIYLYIHVCMYVCIIDGGELVVNLMLAIAVNATYCFFPSQSPWMRGNAYLTWGFGRWFPALLFHVLYVIVSPWQNLQNLCLDRIGLLHLSILDCTKTITNSRTPVNICNSI